MEYSGCLYEKPTSDEGQRDLRVDPVSGIVYPFDLTRSEIMNMDFRNVPVKIEHTYEGFTSKDGNEVGTVREVITDPVTGYTAVKFGLHDTVAGRTISRLIDSGGIGELSLGHLYDPQSGKVSASEVSVCYNGARSGSRLYKENEIYDRFKLSVQAMSAPESSTAATPETVVDLANPLAAALGGNGVSDASTDLLGLLESVTSSPGVNQDQAIALFQQIAGIVGERATHTSENDKQRRIIAELQQKIDTTVDKTKVKASQLLATMNALMREYGGEDAPVIENVEGDAAFRQIAYNLPVLASALHAHKQATFAKEKDQKDLSSIRASLSAEIKRHMSPSPWQEPEYSAVPNAGPSMQVNASTRVRDPPAEERPSKSRFGLTPGQQAAIAGFSRFGDGAEGRVTPDMLPANYYGKAPQ